MSCDVLPLSIVSLPWCFPLRNCSERGSRPTELEIMQECGRSRSSYLRDSEHVVHLCLTTEKLHEPWRRVSGESCRPHVHHPIKAAHNTPTFQVIIPSVAKSQISIYARLGLESTETLQQPSQPCVLLTLVYQCPTLRSLLNFPCLSKFKTQPNHLCHRDGTPGSKSCSEQSLDPFDSHKTSQQPWAQVTTGPILSQRYTVICNSSGQARFQFLNATRQPGVPGRYRFAASVNVDSVRIHGVMVNGNITSSIFALSTWEDFVRFMWGSDRT